MATNKTKTEKAVIIFYDTRGHVVGRVERSRRSRPADQAKEDRERMIAFKEEHPEAQTAKFDGQDYFFNTRGESVLKGRRH